MTCIEIENAVAQDFGFRQNIIVPNVSWGLGLHECDLLIVSKSGWATEVEIKVSKSDLKKDLKKVHGHHNKKIKYLFFAIPEKLEAYIDLIPERAGVLVIRPTTTSYNLKVDIVRAASRNEVAIKLDEKEISHLMHLGCMRIWSLKNSIIGMKNTIKHLKNDQPNPATNQ